MKITAKTVAAVALPRRPEGVGKVFAKPKGFIARTRMRLRIKLIMQDLRVMVRDGKLTSVRLEELNKSWVIWIVRKGTSDPTLPALLTIVRGVA